MTPRNGKMQRKSLIWVMRCLPAYARDILLQGVGKRNDRDFFGKGKKLGRLTLVLDDWAKRGKKSRRAPKLGAERGLARTPRKGPATTL